MTRDQRRRVVLAPLLTWAALVALVGATFLYAFLPDVPGKAEAGLAFATAKALLIAWLFMQLRKATSIVRLAAVAGVAWASLLYLFALADVLTR